MPYQCCWSRKHTLRAAELNHCLFVSLCYKIGENILFHLLVVTIQLSFSKGSQELSVCQVQGELFEILTRGSCFSTADCDGERVLEPMCTLMHTQIDSRGVQSSPKVLGCLSGGSDI